MKTQLLAGIGSSRAIAAAVTIGIVASGCTHVGRLRTQVRAELEEHSRALTTAVVDSLAAEANRSDQSELALKLAREDQRIEGLPLEPIGLEESDRLEKRFARIEKLIAKERQSTEKLAHFGEELEEERNARKVRWTKWLTGGSLGFGGLVALVVFVPATLPIVGRLLGWLVGKIPQLAGAVGVVSVRAFDAVVRGIEKSQGNSGERLSNESEALKVSLSREMDASHKELVRTRKVAQS